MLWNSQSGSELFAGACTDRRTHPLHHHPRRMAPNIVPDYAQSWFYVRAPKRELVEDVFIVGKDCARAAMMTETLWKSTS
jgi:metal-dependent amidase/aminoacylase/carboxypeptidase family protein